MRTSSGPVSRAAPTTGRAELAVAIAAVPGVVLDVLLAAVFAALLAACATAASERFYRLGVAAGGDSPAPVAGAAIPPYAGDLRVIVASIPASLDRPQLALQRGPNELLVLEDARWAEPLRDGVAHCLEQSLARDLPQAWIAADGPARGVDPVTVTVTIEAMNAGTDGRTGLQARWLIRSADGARAHVDHLTVERAARGAGTAAVVAAWSEELDALAGTIAASLAGMPATP